LQDSWRRAHAFSGQYEALLRRCGRFDGIGLAPGQQLAGVSLQPLVDEVTYLPGHHVVLDVRGELCVTSKMLSFMAVTALSQRLLGGAKVVLVSLKC
jgi:hypothetical protein